MMTPTQAMTASLTMMTDAEVHYVLAYCDGEVRRCAENSAAMDKFEARRLAAERELTNRRNR